MTTNRYNTPEEGTTEWHIPLNENFERLEQDIEIRDTGSNLSAYDPTEGSKFLATDTSEVFLGDGDQWNAIGSLRSGSREADSTASHSVYVRETSGGRYVATDADGSQISDDSDGAAVLQAGIDSCPDDGSIHIAGEFDIDTTITLGDGKRLVGYDATITIAETSNNIGFALEVCNGSRGATQRLQRDADARDNELYVSDASSFSEGDHVSLDTDRTFTASGATGLQYSEKHLIDRIDTSNDVLYLMEGVYFDYATSDNARVTQVIPDSGHLEGLTVTNEADDPDGNYRFANAIRGHNVTYRNLTLKNVGRTGLGFDECYGGTVTGCDVTGIHRNASGYGVRIRKGCANTLISNNHFRACRHAVAHNYAGNRGMPRKTLIIGNIILGTHQGATLDAHEGTLDWAIIGNHITANDSSAVLNGAKDTCIYNNTFLGTYESDERQGGFHRARGNPPQSTLTVRGNSIKHAGRLGGVWINHPGPWTGVDISDNYIQDTAYYFVRIQEDIEFLRVADNVFDDAEHGSDGREAILVENSVDSIDSAQISGNAFRSYDEAIHVEQGAGTISNFSVTGNTVYATPWDRGDNAFEFGELTDSVIADNTFHDPDDNLGDAITMASGTQNNLIRDNSIHSTGGISDSGSNNVTDGNYRHDGSGWSQL